MGLFDDLLEEEDKIQPTQRRGLFDDLLEEEDIVRPAKPTRATVPQAGLLPPIEEMFKPKPKEVGTIGGIINAARNAFASSQQALAVTGGVTPEEAKEISKIEYEKNARQVSPDYKAYQEAQGFDAVKAFVNNPIEVTTNIVAEGLAGSLPALGAGLAAGGAGALVAAPTVVGAPAGFLAGQVAGTFAGSLATEYGSKVLEELQNEGMDLSDPNSITDFFSRQELVDKAKDKALKRGVPIAAFDALSAGIGGKVAGITKAAFKTKTREAAAEMAVQAALGGGGEVAGSLVAGEKIDPKAVFAEVVGEVGPGAAEIGVGKIQQTLAERRKQEQIKRAAKVSQDLENNNAPLTSEALKTTVAKNAVAEEKATTEATDAALAKEVEKVTGMRPIREEEAEKFAPPEDIITKQELKTQYLTLSPEELADTETTFRERLDDEDAEMRTFAQNALDAIAEVRAEQAKARKLPTDVLPTETPGATYGREADIYDVFADIRRRPMPPSGPAFESAQVIEEAARRADILRRTPEGRDLLRRELQGEEMTSGVRRAVEETLATAPEVAEGDVFAEIRRPSRAEEAAITIEQQLTEDERIRRSQLGAEALREELAQAESLARVADNTATDEEVVRLARQGLVNIQDGQNVITPRGEEVMQRAGAPLPALTPEERTAEIAAQPTEPAAIVEQEPVTPAPVTTPAPAEIPAAPAVTTQTIETKVKVEELKKGDRFRSGDNEYEVVYLGGERRAGQGLSARPVAGPRYQQYLNALEQNRRAGITGFAAKDTGLIGFSRNSNVTKIEVAPTAPAAPAAEPAGIAVGNRVKKKRGPTTYIVLETLEPTPSELRTGERSYSVRNERTGEVEVINTNDEPTVVQGKGVRKMAVEEKISKTALIDKDGSVISAPNKNHAMLMEESQFNLDDGEFPPTENFGFVTNFGRFVNQKEAQEIAQNSRQVVGSQPISGEIVTAINEDEAGNILKLNAQGASGNKFNEVNFARFSGKAVARTNSETLTSHPLYNAAKRFNNIEAAKIIVDEFVDDQMVFDVFAGIDQNKPAYIVPVLKGEADSMNMLPIALAEKLSTASGIPIWGNLIQATSEQSTGAGVNEKTEISRQFMGEAPPAGAQIIIVDDYLATGRTIASLENMTGTASAVATIAFGRYGNQYGLTTERADKMLQKANVTRDRFYEIYGKQPEQAITGIEAQAYILNGAAGESGLTSRFPIEKISPSNEGIKNIANVPESVVLFAGGGLTELGLVGIVRNGYVVEANQRIAEFYEEAHGVPVIQDYVQNVKFYGINGGHLHASPVCKNFSTAKNKQQVTEQDKVIDREAARAVAQAIRDIQPNTVSIENVIGYKDTESYNSIIFALEENGYVYDANFYNANDFGAPTSRKRLIVRAVKKGGVLPEIKKKNKKVSWYDAVKDIVNDLPNHDITAARYPARMMSNLEAKGIDIFNVDQPLLISGTDGKTFRNADQPAMTFLASPKSLNIIALPGGIIKKVTARAMARMTGVPDSFPLPADEALAKTIVGNGIPPALTRSVIGDLIIKNQKPDVFTPEAVPQKNQYTYEEAVKAVDTHFGKQGIPEGIVIVNNTTDPDLEMKAGYFVNRGQIVINLAYIAKGENLGDIIDHELGHYIFSDPKFQADFKEFWEMMTPEEQAKADEIINQFYNKETGAVQMEEKKVRAFMQLVQEAKAQPKWRQILDTIKRWINEKLGTNFQVTDRGALSVLAVAHKKFKSGERIIREINSGVLKSAETAQDAEYLAAVERGDMETAQRMVDEAAKRAGYTIGPVWHGTNIDFTEFDKKKSKSNNRFGKGFYFAKEKERADSFANDAVKSNGGTPIVKRFYLKDSVFNYLNAIFVANTPKEIKSADPVTYDDAGNVIPLSQRFRATSPDIRRMAVEPTAEAAPAEKVKRRTKMQNIASISERVKVAKTKLTEDEIAALKTRIETEARRSDRQTQKEFAKDVTQYLRELTIRGKVSAPQLRAITGKAMQTQFNNNVSIKNFLNYANKVIENANYEKDVSNALATIKRANQLAKGKKGSARIKAILEELAKINPRDIEPSDMSPQQVEIDGEIVTETPISVAQYTAVLKEYMASLGPVTAEEYRVVPEAEILDFMDKLKTQAQKNIDERIRLAFERKLQKALDNKALLPNELEALKMNSPEEYEEHLRKKEEEQRKKIENAITELALDAQSSLVTYEPAEITSDKKEILDFMRAINVAEIPIGDRKAYVMIANNIIVNNDFSGAQKFASIAAGQIGAAEAAKDSKQVKRNSASLNFLRTLLKEKTPSALIKFENLVNMSGQSFADTFRNFAGKENMARFLYQMGFGKVEIGQAKANRERREITDGIQARFQQIEEKTGQKISDKQGIISMGVASHLIQSTPDETEAEALTRMRNLIKQDIDKKKNAPDVDDRKDAAYIEKGLREVDADTVQGVLDNLKRLHPANYEALIFLKDEVLPEYKPLLKEHDELFNNQTDNYTNANYLPIRYRAFTRALQKKEDIERRDNVGVTAPKQSPNSIKRVKNTVIPKDRQLDYNITKNVLDSLSIGLEAAYTNAGWEQVNAFLESPDAEAAFNGPENLQFFKDRLSSVRRARLRKVYKMDGWDRLADVFANFIRTVGGGMVLGGFGQAFKQYPSQFATTAANVIDPKIISQSLLDIKAATPLMQMFSIGERGEIAGGSKWANQLEGNFSKLEQYMIDGALPKIKNTLSKMNDVWLLALKKSDTAAAAHGWISYYRKYLKDNNIPFTNWENEVALVEQNDRSRVEAGLYADQMIDLYQGSSDPTKMAVFAQRGDSGGGNLLKAMIIPFSSFVIQERSRITSDIRDLTYGDTQEKKDAAKGLVATVAGILLFHTMRRYGLPLITGGIATGAYALLGVDMEEPDEEEQKKKEDKVFRQFLGEIAANILVGGYSSMAENALIDSVNRLAYAHDIYTGSDNVLDDEGNVLKFETYRKERAPMYRYTGPGADSALGMVDILPSQLSDNFDKLMDIADEELMDSLTEEEQRVLILAALSETLYTLRLNDADVDRLLSRMSKEVKEQAEDRARAQKALQRLYGQ